jgi:hypothetical protein
MTARTIPAGLRWFASVIALTVAIGATVIGGSFGFSFLYWELPSLLLVGAILSGKAPAVGRFLMWFGAAILTVLFLPMAIQELFILHRYGSVDGYLSFNHYHLQKAAAAIAVIVSVTAIDIALVVETVTRRKLARN